MLEELQTSTIGSFSTPLFSDLPRVVLDLDYWFLLAAAAIRHLFQLILAYLPIKKCEFA
jgi:hypothetical protein